MMLRVLLLVLLAGLSVGRASDKIDAPSEGASKAVTQPHVVAELIPEMTTIEAGKPFGVILHLHMDPSWHTYWINPGDAGVPTTIKWTLPPGFTAGPIQWPVPEKHVMDGLVTYGYEGDAYLVTTITPPATGDLPEHVDIKAKANWLVCQEACIPGKAELTVTLDSGVLNFRLPVVNTELFEKARKRLPVQNSRWEVSAAYGQRSIGSGAPFPSMTITFMPKPDAIKAFPTNAEFFPEQANVLATINHPQSFFIDAKTAVLTLDNDLQQNGDKPDKLSGVLVSDTALIGDAKAVYISDFPALQKPAAAGQAVETGGTAQSGYPDAEAVTVGSTSLTYSGGTTVASGTISAANSELAQAVAGAGSAPVGTDVPISGGPSAPPAADATSDASAGAARTGRSPSLQGNVTGNTTVVAGADASGSTGSLPVHLPSQMNPDNKLSGPPEAAGEQPLLIAVLGAAFVGGLILNLMPCVLPVLSLKVFALIRHAGGHPGQAWKQGAAFTAGVVISFWVLAGLLLGLRAAGNQLGWGFQMQSPGFVAGLIVLFFLIGLNLFGVFEIGGSLVGVDAKAASHAGGSVSSFLNGALATVAATPCTAPFMGSALGFAAQQSAFVSMLIFTFLALGMAAPYLLLTIFPQSLRFVPKPGAWMESLKQFMGFLLMGTVIFLVYVFGALTSEEQIPSVLFALLLIASFAWAYGRWRFIGLLCSVVLVSVAVFSLAALRLLDLQLIPITNATEPGAGPAPATTAHDGYQDWSPEAVQAALKSGQPVFVDFTAAWCLSCKVNERVALGTDAVKKAFADKNVALFRADWTHADPVISQTLQKFNRDGVPLYLLYSPKAPDAPQVLPEVLTPGIVLDALGKI